MEEKLVSAKHLKDELYKQLARIGKCLSSDKRDLRPAEEYDAGHIVGALSVPMEELDSFMRDIPNHAEVIAYCSIGNSRAVNIVWRFFLLDIDIVQSTFAPYERRKAIAWVVSIRAPLTSKDLKSTPSKLAPRKSDPCSFDFAK